MIVIVMGVSGSGKTTVGQALAADLGWPFLEGDEFQPPENVAKMARGTPLTDADRLPWLISLQRQIRRLLDEGKSAVVAASALKREYRDVLRVHPDQVRFVYLKGDYDLIERRMQNRGDHFMKPEMLRSQFATLEEPRDAITLSVRRKPEAIIDSIKRRLPIATDPHAPKSERGTGGEVKIMGKVPTLDQISAGGVAYRRVGGRIEVALIRTLMSGKDRWQLPKGIIGKDETPEITALREVQEETGITAHLLNLIDLVEYWYYATTRKGVRVRYHKKVHFYLMQYVSGAIRGQAGETLEARWVEIGEAITLIAFQSEQQIVARAQELIEAYP